MVAEIPRSGRGPEIRVGTVSVQQPSTLTCRGWPPRESQGISPIGNKLGIPRYVVTPYLHHQGTQRVTCDQTSLLGFATELSHAWRLLLRRSGQSQRRGQGHRNPLSPSSRVPPCGKKRSKEILPGSLKMLGGAFYLV